LRHRDRRKNEHNSSRRTPGRDQRHRLAAAGKPIDQLFCQKFRLIQMRLGVWSVGLVSHRIAVVDDDDMKPRSLPRNCRKGALVASHRTGQRQAKQQQHAASHRQQQPLLESQPSAVFAQCLEQKLHGRPLYGLESAAIEDVNDNRNGREQSARDEESGSDEAEGKNS